MRIIKEIICRDLKKNAKEVYSKSIRGIIKKNNELFLVKTKYGDYLFPGGRSEKAETEIDTLIREVKEETGLNVKADSIIPYGKVIFKKNDKYISNAIYVKEDIYYLCDVTDKIENQQLSAYETKLGYELSLVNPKDAYEKNRRMFFTDFDLSDEHKREDVVLYDLIMQNEKN